MNFEYRTESIRTAALHLDYFLVPWDTQILGLPVAEVCELRILQPARAAEDYGEFARWCTQQQIALCGCRLATDRLAESMFLEERGFRFIELNYLPELTGLQTLQIPDEGVQVQAADERDREPLADMAARALRHGRFHQDPRIDPALGARRYRAWMINAFSRPNQRVLKCAIDGEIVGFFVVESRQAGHCFWSLIGLAPGLQGRGLGKRVWRAALRAHQAEGVDTVSTSISSHNIPVHNLYAGMGFRFPQPSITLHWCPAGSIP